jgi:hypothetical protein
LGQLFKKWLASSGTGHFGWIAWHLVQLALRSYNMAQRQNSPSLGH